MHMCLTLSLVVGKQIKILLRLTKAINAMNNIKKYYYFLNEARDNRVKAKQFNITHHVPPNKNIFEPITMHDCLRLIFGLVPCVSIVCQMFLTGSKQ